MNLDRLGLPKAPGRGSFCAQGSPCRYFFVLPFFALAPYLLRAAFSHVARVAFERSFPHAFNALASFCARVNALLGHPVAVIGVD